MRVFGEMTRRRLKQALLAGAGAVIGSPALPAVAQDGMLAALDPLMVGAAGAIGLGLASLAWAMRVSAASRSQSVTWSTKLAEMEAQLEKADAVLSAHPGLVLVWEDDYDAVEQGWGLPKILGGPAALASLMSFARENDNPLASPIDRLLDTLGDLPVEDDGPPEDIKKLKDKVRELRAHGIAFSGSIVTSEGRAIEADGRVAGGQVALWLTDPAVRMAEDSGFVGKVRERTTDLHGALSLLERAPLPAWRRGADFSLIWVNRAYAEAVEAVSAAAVLKDQIELEPGVRKIAEKAAAERRPTDGRIIVNIRGDRRVLKVTETPMHAAGDAALGGFAVDITELDKTRADLRQHIEANRRTLDQIPTAVAMFGTGQNLLYYNHAYLELWGLDDGDLSGQPTDGEILDLLSHAGKLPAWPDYADWKASQLSLYTAELPGAGAGRDGEAPDEIWHLPDGRTLRVARARHPLGGVLAVFDDITERLDLETRYNTQINVQRATLNNLAEGVAVFAADGALRLHNAAFQKLWRLDSDMLSGRPHVDRVLAALKDQTRSGADAVADIKRRVTSLSPEDRTSLKDMTISLIDGRTLAFGAEPLPDGATLVYFHDVTDSREREKELKERNAFLEDIDRQKSKFVDHVSYQLRTPLATIVGFAEMLDGQMFGVLNDRQKDYVASILSAAHHLKDLITDIIDLAVIDAGKMTIDPGEVDVRDLLENAATYAALKAEDTQVSLRVDCPKDIGPITADAKRLKQVLFNLLSNAFAYTGAGGGVILGADRAPGLVRIWVADTGRGVSPEDQAKAFDPFESRGPSAGAGIGLSLVQRFIALHGGWVRMESEPGHGTRVTCYLPAQAKLAPAPASPPEPKTRRATAATPKKEGAPRRRASRAKPTARAAE
ncbi:MAG: PAS-domain containing protein [Pseudomonadota bacterium]|nr:PAS-domain containing protein [Pseudomonadota bacterium]